MIKPYYQDESSTIYHGDCREILPELEPVDLVLTDPPYGIGEASGKNGKNHGCRTNLAPETSCSLLDWDDQRADADLILLAMGLSRGSIIFGGNYYADILSPSMGWLVWDKQNSGDFADVELAWTSFNRAARLKRHRWNGMIRKGQEQRWHPTQKPLDVMVWCIQQADKAQENNIILDPFLGSGTTLVAAKNLGRKAIGIELEEKYCEIAVNRLRQEVLPLTG